MQKHICGGQANELALTLAWVAGRAGKPYVGDEME